MGYSLLVKTFRLCAFVFILFTISACQNYVDLEYQAVYKDSISAEKNNLAVLKKPKILLVADNQKALVATAPIFEQSSFSEKTVNTAHRKPALDAFSTDILVEIINKTDAELIIHAGDLLNNSCRSEFEMVTQTLAGKTWFAAPGNHDGYFLGISSPRDISRSFSGPIPFLNNQLLDERAGWAQVCTPVMERKCKRKDDNSDIPDVFECEDASKDKELIGFGFSDVSEYHWYQNNVLDKLGYNTAYLEAIGIDKTMRLDAVPTPIKIKGYDKHEGYSVKCIDFLKKTGSLHKGYMSNVCWTEFEGNEDGFNDFKYDKDQSRNYNYKRQFDERSPWKNFIVQKLNVVIDKRLIDILIIDTSSYIDGVAVKENGRFRIGSYGAADAGYISRPQMDVIDALFDENKETVIVGHHPLVDFDENSYKMIHKLFVKGSGVTRYISGDTHDGYEALFKRKHVSKEGKENERVVREVNLGSTIDAPIEYALLGVDINNVLRTQRFSLTPLKLTKGEQQYKAYKKTNGKVAKRDIGTLNKGGNGRSNPSQTEKLYGTFDDDIWTGMCGDNGWYFDHNGTNMTPVFDRGYKSNLSSYRIKQPISYFLGLPYLLRIDNPTKIYIRSQYAYKINRLIELAEVYSQLLYVLKFEKEQDPTLVSLEKAAESSLNSLQDEGLMAYLNLSHDPFHTTLKNLSKLVLHYEVLDLGSKEAKVFKLCSALYEAEREFRSAWLD